MKGKEELYQCLECSEIFEPVIGVNSQHYKRNVYSATCGDFKEYSKKNRRYRLYCYKCYLDKIEKDISILIKEKFTWNVIHEYIEFQDYKVTLTSAKGTFYFENKKETNMFLKLKAKDDIEISMPIDLSDKESIKNGIIDAITLMPKERKDKRAIKERSDKLKRERKHDRNYTIIKVGFYTGLAEICGLWPITAAILAHLDIVTFTSGPNLAFVGWVLWVAFASGIIFRYPDGPPWE